METIEIMVRNKIPRFKKDSAKSIITWNTGYIINFDFDEEWDETKTIRIVDDRSNLIEDKIFTGNSVELPKVTNTSYIGIGVFSGDLKSTTTLILSCKKSILEEDVTPLPPTEDVYSQIMKVLNDKATKSHTHNDYALSSEVPTKASDLENDIGYLTEHQDISGLASKATTLNGYGITDAYTSKEVDNKFDEVNKTIGDVSYVISLVQKEVDEVIELQNSYIGGDVR